MSICLASTFSVPSIDICLHSPVRHKGAQLAINIQRRP